MAGTAPFLADCSWRSISFPIIPLCLNAYYERQRRVSASERRAFTVISAATGRYCGVPQ